ncbi:hypothetical protein POSPLADRAFT_1065593 [Postia placenta MAD-698-R-SB12]|uniref:Carboxypeptidase n=1 Tax=Postia placenta MAD-698-R-SB12 TaxID=670580 RepID=A0A1X6N792_9APHY|nr:hypothetical protein POSPLADRAFT_1065593 [Postia placenta MAD-698-R-SB12]OSX64454.1 hypothetical protein POSPLADRAFT_1065593 [Postia placenta MAD-698-R-SB12]
MLPLPLLALVASSILPIVNGQISSSWPQAYPGMPDLEYGPAWQNYFEVTEPLPNNGPIHLNPDFSAYENNYSFSNLADYFWIDQPVGTGWSTADDTGFVYDEDQVGTDFMGFLENLVKVFPSLATRPLYLTGESYAGTYIPYITKAYFGLSDPPVNLAKIVIGDGTVGSDAVFQYLPTTTVIQTYPQLIGYDPEVFQWFVEQTHLCGYDLNLTYPQDGHFPDLQLVYPTAPGRASQVYFASKQKSKAMMSKRELLQEGRRRYGDESVHARGRANMQRREVMKRDLAGRANGTIDPWYGCFIYDAMIEYALNFTYPWMLQVYDLPDALDPEIPLDGDYFFNGVFLAGALLLPNEPDRVFIDPQTVAALHAPTSKQWVGEMDYYPFLGRWHSSLSLQQTLPRGVFPSSCIQETTTRSSLTVAQKNTTFGGIQGFTKKPATPWYADDGSFAGIVHQERNWTYILFKGAGHLVAQQQPANAYTFLREFVLGSNTTGLVSGSNGQVSVVGGEVSSLAQDVLPGQSGIYVGSGVTQSTYTFPSATIAAWESYITTATASPTRLAAQVRSTSGAKPTARPFFHF